MVKIKNTTMGIREFYESRSRIVKAMPSGKPKGKFRRQVRGSKIERALRPEQRRRRAKERSALCRRFPGTVVTGREGVVQYPNKYDWVERYGPGNIVVSYWEVVGSLYE